MKQLPQNSKQSVGKKGEDLACQFLKEKGYSVIERNFRIRYGEIDVVAKDGDTLVFVEVKTRTSDTFGIPEEAITPKKMSEMIHAAAAYVICHPDWHGPERIDVIAVVLTKNGQAERITHIKNVSG